MFLAMQCIYKIVQQLIEEMNSHKKSHVKMLEKIQMGSTTMLDPSMPSQDQLAPEVESLWSSVIKNFETCACS